MIAPLRPGGARLIASGLLLLCLAAAVSPGSGSGPAVWPPERLAVNSAGREELSRVPGIGRRTARALVEYRRRYGPFCRWEDLRRVQGIGAARLERLRAELELDSPATAPLAAED